MIQRKNTVVSYSNENFFLMSASCLSLSSHQKTGATSRGWVFPPNMNSIRMKRSHLNRTPLYYQQKRSDRKKHFQKTPPSSKPYQIYNSKCCFSAEKTERKKSKRKKNTKVYICFKFLKPHTLNKREEGGQ